jgi:hypothetical protein
MAQDLVVRTSILRGLKGKEAWRSTKPSRPLSKMGHAREHLPDFKKIDPDINENEVAQILEHVRKTSSPRPGPHGDQIFENVVEIGGKQILVRVVESAGGIIKTGYPVVP